MAYNPLSKFQVVESPLQQLPHKCAGCGTYGEQQPTELKPATKFIDFGLELEFYGKVYFCINCFTDIGNQLGYKSEAQYSDLQIKFESTNIQLEKMDEENEELRHALASLNNVFGSGPAVTRVDRVVNPPVREEKRADPEPKSELSGDESGSDESANVEGYSGLPDNELDELLKDI